MSIVYKKKKRAPVVSIGSTLCISVISICFTYNIYTNFFPINDKLGHDEAEHLHVAYLLSIGQKPFVDFIENHPTLFNHFLWRVWDGFDIVSSRSSAILARTIIFIHFVLCILLFVIWISRHIKERPNNLLWIAMLLSSWAMLDFFNPYLMSIWEIRSDFICYAYTAWGCFLICNGLCSKNNKHLIIIYAQLLIGGTLIGIGNAVLPKGVLFILPLFLTFFASALINKQFSSSSPLFSLKNLLRLLTAIVAILVSFSGAVLLDCHLSHIFLRTWISGVYSINTRKHIIFSADNDNPIFVLLNFFHSPIVIVLFLSLWSVFEISRMSSQKTIPNSRINLWLFCIFTFLVNLLLPCYSNGVTWAYNYIPSLFAMAIFFLLFILKIRETWQTYSPHRMTSPISVGLFAVAVWVLIPICYHPLHALKQIRSRTIYSKLLNKVYGNEYSIDAVLPAAFTYLTRAPNRIPIRSKHWGYYSMLWRDHSFWKDYHRLGLGPDPGTYWHQLFTDNPPDAITFENPYEIVQFAMVLQFNNQLDITWLFKKIRHQYSLMSHKGFSMYVRSDKVPEITQRGWRKTYPSKGLLPECFTTSRYDGDCKYILSLIEP